MTPAEKRIEHIESVYEELKLNGYDCKIYKNIIIYHSPFGTINYSCSEKTVMGDFYRFISHLGIKMHNYGLENKLEENLKQFKK